MTPDIIEDAHPEDKAPQGCDLSAAGSADCPERLQPLRLPNSLPESAKSQGAWGRIPHYKNALF